jgi:predicted PhzF superfamily epimerase YddE/YHI9
MVMVAIKYLSTNLTTSTRFEICFLHILFPNPGCWEDVATGSLDICLMLKLLV